MKYLSRLLLLCTLLAVPTLSFAASNELLLVFSSNSELNRHLYSLMGQAFGGNYKVSATLQTSAATPGKYKAIIVFSTRATSGLEPSLEAFIKGYPAPAEIYLVSLLSRSNSLAVTPLSKSSTPAGVDGVAAATLWTGASRAMHNQWLQVLVTALKSK
ncbi:MAG: hypothetical protein WCG80_00040 [Spirochaetales bacterium]